MRHRLSLLLLVALAVWAPRPASALWPAATATPTLASATATAAANAAHTVVAANATKTTGVMTATAAVVATQTAANTPTPNPGARANVRRALNDSSRPGGPKEGELWKNNWNARQLGGSLAVATPSGGTPGPSVDVAALTAVVQGVPLTKALGNSVITACGNTTAIQFLKCVLCVNPSATYTWRPGAAAATQEAAPKPVCSHNETEVAYLEIPPDFTSNTTVVTVQMLKQDPAVNTTTAVFGEK